MLILTMIAYLSILHSAWHMIKVQLISIRDINKQPTGVHKIVIFIEF